MRIKKWILTFFQEPYWCLIFAGIVGLLCIKILPPVPVISDFKDYDDIALHIVSTGEFRTISNEEIIYPPLYPYFLSAIYIGLGYNYNFVYFIQFLLLGGIAGTFFVIAKKYFSFSTLLASTLALAILLWPYTLLYSFVLSNEILFMFFLSLSAFYFLKFISEKKKTDVLLSGTLVAFAVLTRPVALLLPLWVFIGLYIFKKIKVIELEKEHFRKGVFIFLLFVALLLPWTLYVKEKFNRFIPVASNLSAVFSKANKTFEYDPTLASKNTTSALLKAKIKNLYLFWNPGASGYHVEILKNKIPHASFLLWCYRIVFVTFVVLGLFSLKFIKKKKEVAVLFSIILYFWALHSVLFPFPRYTLPIMPFVIMLAFYTLLQFKRNA